MATNASSLKAETCGKIAKRLAEIKSEITQCSSLLALVAPVDLNKQKATNVSKNAVASSNTQTKEVPAVQKPASAGGSTAESISGAIQRYKERQSQLKQKHEASQRQMYQEMKEQEAAALSQLPPELGGTATSYAPQPEITGQETVQDVAAAF